MKITPENLQKIEENIKQAVKSGYQQGKDQLQQSGFSQLFVTRKFQESQGKYYWKFPTNALKAFVETEIKDNYDKGFTPNPFVLKCNEIEDSKEEDLLNFESDLYQDARQMGITLALRPQKLIIDLINQQYHKNNYDHLNFFNTKHPINPLMNSAGSYSNLFDKMSLTLENYQEAISLSKKINSLISINFTRQLQPKLLIGSNYLTDTITTISKSENIPSIILKDLHEFSSWYVFLQNEVKGDESDENIAFIYQLRRFSLDEITSYGHLNPIDLNNHLIEGNPFIWKIRIRDKVGCGHPYTMMRFNK